MTCKLRIVISLLCCAAVLAFAGAISASAGNLLGDVDGDGAVTATDVTLIQRTISGVNAGSLDEAAADVDGNGAVEIIDATFIQRMVAKMDTPYPIGVQPTQAPTQAPTQMPTDEDGWGRIIFQP